MSTKVTRERAEEFGASWNSGDDDLVARFFAEDGVYHASVGPDALDKTYFGKEQIRRGVQTFFDRFPGGKFENLKVAVADDIGTFEWDFVSTDPTGQQVRTAGCDLLQFVGDKVVVKNAFANSGHRG
jgi:ketosteroid isomerase-like protein